MNFNMVRIKVTCQYFSVTCSLLNIFLTTSKITNLHIIYYREINNLEHV